MGRNKSDEDVPVVRRWFLAVYLHIELEKSNFSKFYEEYGWKSNIEP
ncbi:hypothetical protein BPO_0035 [Bergeyella porcorum]|uniref:Transposase n=1 Tax=Bergeyella porcorum TaxID=1735111 RepID=A0AAU0EZ65_9FLAO